MISGPHSGRRMPTSVYYARRGGMHRYPHMLVPFGRIHVAIACQCKQCGKKYRLPDHLAGKTGVCTQCKARLTIPASAQPSVQSSGPEAGSNGLSWGDLESLSGGETIRQRVPPIQSPPQTPAGCPGCGAPVAGGAMICVNCGYNFQTGSRLSTNVEAPPPVLPASRSPARTERGAADEAASSGWNSWALLFTVFGIGAPLLPLGGRQFILLSIFGDFAVFAGIPCGIVAAILWYNRRQPLFAAGSVVASVVALIIAFVCVSSDSGNTADTTPGSSGQQSGVLSSGNGQPQQVQQLKAEIEAEARRVMQMETEITQMDSQLRLIESKAHSAEMRVNRSMLLVKTEADKVQFEQAKAEYESLRNQYNTLREKRNAKSSEYKTMLDSVNAKVSRYNGMR